MQAGSSTVIMLVMKIRFMGMDMGQLGMGMEMGMFPGRGQGRH